MALRDIVADLARLRLPQQIQDELAEVPLGPGDVLASMQARRKFRTRGLAAILTPTAYPRAGEPHSGAPAQHEGVRFLCRRLDVSVTVTPVGVKV
jgi:hypothetical protein